MATHDAYARRTPFEMVFPDPDRAGALAEAVTEEAAGRGVDPSHPHMFLTLGAVGAFLGEIQDPDAPPGAVHTYGALAYHGVHFERAGRPLFLLSTTAARRLVAEAPEGAAEPPTSAGYLQLPQHLFWLEGEDESVPESIDGLFWTVAADRVHVLLATGMRPDRPGLGATPLPEAPLADATAWKEAKVRPEGTDFETRIPGAEIEALYGVRAAGEPLKLLARVFAHLEAHPAPESPPEGAGEGEPQVAPRPSALPYVRITMEREDDA